MLEKIPSPTLRMMMVLRYDIRLTYSQPVFDHDLNHLVGLAILKL